jgi:hypothetical protein
MSIPIQVNGTIVNFPASGESPNWSSAVIQFAQLVAAALAFSVGPFDVPPQVYVMTSNANTNVNLPNLTFPTSTVRGAIVIYSVFRSTNLSTVSETGQIYVNYNPTFPVGKKWEISNDHVGNANSSFTILDVGQLQFSTTLLAGTGFSGTITYQAKAILQS